MKVLDKLLSKSSQYIRKNSSLLVSLLLSCFDLECRDNVVCRFNSNFGENLIFGRALFGYVG